jgi:hypothetical protein
VDDAGRASAPPPTIAGVSHPDDPYADLVFAPTDDDAPLPEDAAPEFALPEIARYFPSYPSELPRRLGA